MGLFTQLEKFDQKLTRGYARWGRWVWRTLIVVPVLVVLWNGDADDFLDCFIIPARIVGGTFWD
nr:hypothetical protein [Escherichia coli]